MAFQIEIIRSNDREAVLNIARSFWGDERIVLGKEIIDLSELEGLMAVQGREIIGILHNRKAGDECQIITLASTKQCKGVGSKLQAEVEAISSSDGCRLLSLRTTNDNLDALGFYQRRGYQLAEIFPEAVTEARKLKPTIPAVGEKNIPIRDEIRLEKILE